MLTYALIVVVEHNQGVHRGNLTGGEMQSCCEGLCVQQDICMRGQRICFDKVLTISLVVADS